MRPQTDLIQLRSDCNPPAVQSHVGKTPVDQGTVLEEPTGYYTEYYKSSTEESCGRSNPIQLSLVRIAPRQKER